MILKYRWSPKDSYNSFAEFACIRFGTLSDSVTQDEDYQGEEIDPKHVFDVVAYPSDQHGQDLPQIQFYDGFLMEDGKTIEKISYSLVSANK